MRMIAASLAAAALSLVASPATADTTLARCYVETSVAGTFLAAGDREASGGIGAGCDLAVRDITIGALIRGDLGDRNSLSLAAKVGYALNPHLTTYALASWVAPEAKLADSGALFLGAGLETAIQAIRGLSIFGEADIAATKWGSDASKDDIRTRLGFRYRF